MAPGHVIGSWLIDRWHWPRLCLLIGGLLLLTIPPVWAWHGVAWAALILQLPLYLLHQAEEHLGDRFRRYFNETLGKGQPVLSRHATFWINALGVWAFDLLAIAGAVFLAKWFGLAAGYLAVVNAVLHMLPAAVQRRYNPGLITAIALLLPGGVACLILLSPGTTAGQHAVTLGSAVAVHLAILIYVRRRLAKLNQPNAA